MDIGNTMTTLIDDGMVEDYFDDPITLANLEDPKVIDVDNLDAMIEDPGYILEETLDNFDRSDDMAVKYTSSYKKRSVTLPVTFFDISSNICLLMKCRPISIKVVDCNIYPWYYKQKSHKNKDKNVTCTKKDEPCVTFYSVTSDPLSLKCKFSKTSPSTINSNQDRMKLSSEQCQAISKLREEIVMQAYAYEGTGDGVNDIAKGKGILENHEDSLNRKLLEFNKDVRHCNYDKNIESNDLLAYKAIAQTIVRNIDKSQINCKENIAATFNQKPDMKGIDESSCIADGNIGIIISNDHKTNRKKVDQIEKIITSPILTSKIGSRMNITKSKQLFSKRAKNSNKGLEFTCCDSNIQCGKFMSSTHKTVPHYHCTSPMPLLTTNNYYFPSVDECQIKSHYINNDIAIHCAKQNETNNIPLNHIPPTNPAYYFQKDFVPVGNNFVTSTTDFTSIPYNGSFSNSFSLYPAQLSNITEQQLVNNNRMALGFTSNISRQYYNPNMSYFQNKNHIDSAYVHQNYLNVGNMANNDFRGWSADLAYTTIENCVPSHHCSLGYNTQCPLCVNKTHYYSKTHMSSPRPVSNTQSNPLLTQLLNHNESSQLHHSVIKPSGVISRPLSTVVSNTNKCSQMNRPKSQMAVRESQFCDRNNFQNLNKITQPNSNGEIENKKFIEHRSDNNTRALSKNITDQALSRPFNSEDDQHSGGTDRSQHVKKMVTFGKLDNSEPPASVVLNVKAYTDMLNLNYNKSRSCLDSNEKLITNLKNYTELLSISEHKEGSKKININDMINVLSKKKTGDVNSKVEKCNLQSKENCSVLKAILNPIQQQHQLDKSDSLNNEIKINKPNVTLQPKKDRYKQKIIVSEQVNGYSPPILPIPTFKKGLEMCGVARNSNSLTLPKKENNESKEGNKMSDSIKHDHANIIRKRKHNAADDEKKHLNSKKISLQEYMQRKAENEKIMNRICINSGNQNTSAHVNHESTQDLDIQDLGYDSDATVKLDILC